MLSKLFLGISLVGAEWVLYLLVFTSLISVSLIFERYRFFKKATQELESFRNQVRIQATEKNWAAVLKTAESRVRQNTDYPDLETEMVYTLLSHTQSSGSKTHPEVLTEVAHDPVMRAKLQWEKNLATLATIGSNAPFLGLFGTVLGIIQAFHDLANQSAQGVQTVTAGLSEALIATAVGLLVALPAVIAFNLYQRQVKAALTEAESMKSFLIGKLS